MSSRILDVPAKHPFSIFGFLDDLWHSLAENVIQAGWAPLTNLTEAAVVSYVFVMRHKKRADSCYRLMQKITVGQLRIRTSERTYIFPLPGSTDEGDNPEPDLKAELHVVKDTFWVRLCAMGDLGFAEAYMFGEVECDDLISLFQVGLAGRI